MDASEVVSRKQILKDSYQLIPLIVLVILLVRGFSPFIAAVYGIVATFLLTFLKRNTWMSPKKLWETFELSGKNLVMLAVSCAGAGMVISVVTYTGLALGIASVIQSWSGGFLLPALMLIMITSILMGMGMPCTPAYIVAVTIGGPALQALGIDVLTAHLFVFYFAILAEITPPVSIASYCGAAISGADPLKTGFESLRLAIVGFIIPYIFVYNPAFLLSGTFMQIVSLIILVIYAVITLASAFRGYLHRVLNPVEQGLMGILSAALIVVACNQAIMHQLIVQIILIASMVMFFVLLAIARTKSKKDTVLAS
jgi:TRAP-type uncharacterized transport system fused permease subunit